MKKSSRKNTTGKTTDKKDKHLQAHVETTKKVKMQHMQTDDTCQSQTVKLESEKLLKATKNKEHGYVTTLLTESDTLQIDITDDVGKTPLHYLCNGGRTSDVELCLKRRPRVNKMDKLGWTPLHYAAMKGHVDIVPMLVKNGADPNKPDAQKGRTALHLAVSRNLQNMAEQLIQLGADPNIPDQDGKTAMDISKNEFMRDKIVTVAKKVAEQNAEQEKDEESKVICEKMDIPLDKTTPFPNIGLTVTPKPDPEKAVTNNDDIKGKSFTMLIKKYHPDSASELFDIKDDEEICSELFVHQVSRVTGPVMLDICVPVTCPPCNNEELALKTDRNSDILVNNVKEENGKWVCTVTAEVTSFSSFIIVSGPKLEKFNVGKAAASIRSTVDERVELQIPKNTFDKSVTITIGITDMPQKDELTKVMSGCDTILSSTSFYSLDSGGTVLSKPISLLVPLPATYLGDGQLIVLTMNEDPDNETPDSWNLLSAVQQIKHERIHFDVPSFSIKVAVEIPSSLIDSDMESFGSSASFSSISSQVSRVYRKCRRREYTVSLLCLSRRIGTSNTFKIIVQCCKVDQVKQNITHMEQDGYECHTKLANAQLEDELKARSKQRFKVVAKHLNILADKNEVIVEFQPKLETSHQTFNVSIPSNTAMVAGTISFIKLEKAMDKDNETAHSGPDTVDGDVVSSVNVTFLKFHPDMMSKLDGASFLSYKRMIEIQTKIGDKWWKCLLLMKIPLKTLEKSLIESTGNLQETVNGLLFDWREKQRAYKSRGLPVMLSALNRCPKGGLVHDLQVQLSEWKDLPGNNSDEFHDWLVTAYKHDLLIPTTYEDPMSDSYLAMLADRLKPTNKLEKALSLSTGTLSNIKENKKCYPCDGMVTMKLMDTFRKAYSDKTTSFTVLVKSLRGIGQHDVADYALMLANAWLKRQDIEGNEFADAIKQLSSK